MYLYDTQTNIWKQVASMAKERRQHSCAVITTSSFSGNVVLVCGGFRHSDCELYDPATNSWTNGPSLSSPIQSAAMVTAATSSKFAAFILGGEEGFGGYSNRIYGVTKDLSVVTLVGTFRTPRAYHVAVKTNNLC